VRTGEPPREIDVTDDRLTHLRAVGRLLWPPPLELSVGRIPRDSADRTLHQEFLLLPSARRPRLLVPAGRRRAAAGALRRYGVGRGRAARWKARGLAAGVRSGVLPLVARDRVRLSVDGPGLPTAIEGHLSELLGTEVLVSWYLGAPRANRKPVLQVLTPAGRTVAYAKMGIDPLTGDLVRAETAALETLAAAGLRRLTAPQVLARSEWHGLPLLVQSPLPVQGRRRQPSVRRVQGAQEEIASIGRAPAAPLDTSGYWRTLRERVTGLPATPAARQLAGATDAATERFGEVPVSVGAWHGDWTPWNTAQVGDRLYVWDWERFAPAVPVGYDRLHWELQSDLVDRLADPLESARRCVSRAVEQLRPLGLAPDQARATAVGYLTELATRYLADRQSEAGARLGDVGTWLLPAIRSGVDGTAGR
jgi:hypothetical protein